MPLTKALMKKHRGNLKAAWAELRGTKKTKSKARKVTVTQSKPAQSGKGPKMAKRKKRIKSAIKRAHSGVKHAAATKPGQMLVAAAMAAVGGVATSFVLNKTPMLKDLNKGAKAGAQIAMGVAGAFLLKNKMLKAASAGAVVAGVFSAVKAFTGLEPLAGDSSRKLSPFELLQMTKQLNGGMSRPVSYGAALNRPVSYGGGMSRPSMPSLDVTTWGQNGW